MAMQGNPFDQFDAAPAPASGPIMGPPPKPEKPDKPDAPPSGYRFRVDGGLEPIPGGPADPTTKPGGTEKPSQVPVAAEKGAREQVGQFTNLQTARDTFQDEFGGNPIGSMENWAQQYADVGTPGQREWWAAFKATDNQIRNDLFGSALTATEKAAYEATTISPGMRPEIIKQNIERRTKIIEDALSRQRDFMIKNGYKPDAVDAIFAPIVQQQQILQSGAAQQEEQPAPALSVAAPVAGQNGAPTPGAGEGGGEGLAPAGSAGTQTDNPALAGVRAEYKKRLASGQSAEDIIAWAERAGIDPSTYPSIRAQVEDFKRTKRPISDYNTEQLDDMAVPLSGWDRGMNTAAQGKIPFTDFSPGAALIAAGDAASMGTLDNIIGATGGNAERARLGMEQIAQSNPVASTLGTIAGGTTAALGAEGLLGAAGIARGAGRALGADTLFGAATGAGMSDTNAQGGPASMADRLTGAAMGAGAGLAGSYIGGKIGGGLQRVARGVTDPAVTALQKEGVPLTVGQQFGRSGRIGAVVKGMEDRLAGIPGVGDIVNARRSEGLEAWNSKRFDEALKPVGGTVSGKTGEEAVAEAQSIVSDAYSAALKGKQVLPDADFGKDLTGALNRAANIKRAGPEVMDGIVQILKPYDNDPALTGEAMQTIIQELRQFKAGYKGDPLYSQIGKAIDDAEKSVFGMFERQAPDVVPAYKKANAAYRRLQIVQDAVMKGKNAEGIFTPGQLGMTDRANSIKYEGRNATARGDSPFQESQRAAQNVMPNKIPDSGTAGRLILPALALGAGGASDASGATNGAGLTLGAIVAGAYTKAGQRLLTKAGRGMDSKAGRLLESDKTRRAIGAAGAAGAVALPRP